MMYCMRIIHLLNLFVNTYSYIFRVYYNKSKKTDKMNGFRDTLTKTLHFIRLCYSVVSSFSKSSSASFSSVSFREIFFLGFP